MCIRDRDTVHMVNRFWEYKANAVPFVTQNPIFYQITVWGENRVKMSHHVHIYGTACEHRTAVFVCRVKCIVRLQCHISKPVVHIITRNATCCECVQEPWTLFLCLWVTTNITTVPKWSWNPHRCTKTEGLWEIDRKIICIQWLCCSVFRSFLDCFDIGTGHKICGLVG